MLDCWSELPEMRPSFTDLCQVFTSMLEEDSYLEYFNFSVSVILNYNNFELKKCSFNIYHIRLKV